MSSFYEQPSEANSRLGGIELLRMLRRHLGLMLLVVFAGMALTSVWIFRQGVTYDSTAALLLKTEQLPTEAVNQNRAPTAVTSTQVFTEVEVLRSREFVSQLARRLDLMTDPRFNPALREPRPPTVIDRFLERLGFAEAEDPRDLTPERQHAVVIASLETHYSVSASTQHNVIEIRARHPDAQMTARIANEAAQLFIDQQVADQLAELDRDIRFMRQRSQEISAKLGQQQATMTSLIRNNQLRDDAVVRTLLAEQSRLRNRLEATGENAPGSAELKTRIETIDAELAERVGAEFKLAEHELALRTETSRLDAINKRLDELEAQRGTPTPSASQISFAEVPTVPSGPNAESTLAIAFVIFSLLAVVSVMLRESLDNRVLSQDQAETLTGLEVLASLPRIPKSILRRHRSPHMCVAHDAVPGFSNAVRALVTAAMKGAEPGRAPIVYIGSAKSTEGKSTIASCMAVAAAMDDLRVLLIDFDVHRSGSTRNFGVRRGKIAFGDALSSHRTLCAAIRKTQHAGVDLLNFQPGSRISRRVLQTAEAQDVLDAVRADYDLLIVDTPPYLASEEAGRLDGIVDKAILVSRWGDANRETLSLTARMMRRNGLHVIGIAMNGISPKSAETYGYLAYCSDYYSEKEPADA